MREAWRIRSKIVASFASVLLLLACSLFLSIHQIDSLFATAVWLKGDGLRKSTLAQTVQRDARAQQAALMSLFIVENRDARVDIYTVIDQRKAAVSTTLEALKKETSSPEEQGILENIVQSREAFQAEYDVTVELLELDRVAAARLRMNRSTSPLLDTLTQHLGKLVSLQNARLEAQVQASADSAAYAKRMSLILAVIAIIVAGISAAVLTRSIRLTKRTLEARVAMRTDELRVSNLKLAELIATDSLTGIGNRRRFDEVLGLEWKRAARTGQTLGLAMIDVDFFKKYNDQYGHLAGDECLQRVAAALKANIGRTGDLVARYGGEEFVFIVPNTNIEHALGMAVKLCKQIQALNIDHELSEFGCVTVSIGVASFVPATTASSDSLVRAADNALYLAKNQGRNRALAMADLNLDGADKSKPCISLNSTPG